jgi:hypothetical protein
MRGQGGVWDWKLPNGVKVPFMGEVIGDQIYERRTITSGTTQSLTFFDGTAPKNRLFGKLVNGTLPADTYFRIHVVRLVLHSKTQAQESLAAATVPFVGMLNDLWLFYNLTIAKLTILNKPYVESLAAMMPPGFGIAHAAFSAGDTAAGTTDKQSGCWGEPSPRSCFTLGVPLVLPPLSNFPFDLQFFGGAAGVAGALTFAGGDTDVSVIFDGLINRPVQ